jgi:hypothetical protein
MYFSYAPRRQHRCWFLNGSRSTKLLLPQSDETATSSRIPQHGWHIRCERCSASKTPPGASPSKQSVDQIHYS